MVLDPHGERVEVGEREIAGRGSQECVLLVDGLERRERARGEAERGDHGGAAGPGDDVEQARRWGTACRLSRMCASTSSGERAAERLMRWFHCRKRSRNCSSFGRREASSESEVSVVTSCVMASARGEGGSHGERPRWAGTSW